MSIVDWIFVTGIALAIVSLLVFFYFLVRFLGIHRLIIRLPKRRIKNKKKQQMLTYKRQKLVKKRKQYFLICFIFLMTMIILAGFSRYISYYQAMNLTKDDSESVIKGYYLLKDFEQQVTFAKEKTDDEEKLQKNIRYLATTMASYGTKTASTTNSQEGQLTLNRYYNAIKQVGMNASTQTKNFYGNTQVVNDFLEDIKKAKTYEKEVFSYYKVDESAFFKEK